MAWITENRGARKSIAGPNRMSPTRSSRFLQVSIPRYPTRRAVLLRALHAIQHAYNWIPIQAMEEIAAFLDLAQAEVMDTATFYEEYWLRAKGKYLVQVCRSLTCEVCQSKALTAHCKKTLGIEIGETTADGKFTLVEVECLGACGTAPVALINEVLFEDLTPEKLDAVLKSLPDDPHDFRDPLVAVGPGRAWPAFCRLDAAKRFARVARIKASTTIRTAAPKAKR